LRDRYVRLSTEHGTVVCERCLVAETALKRMRGLLGRPRLASGEGLLLRPASSIHTWFMRYPIDVVFVDEDLVVQKVTEHLRPWRFSAHRGARAVVELPSGEAAQRGVEPGRRLLTAPGPS
jgi:uncharacterized membrane protein (UPF0127 family)